MGIMVVVLGCVDLGELDSKLCEKSGRIFWWRGEKSRSQLAFLRLMTQ